MSQDIIINSTTHTGVDQIQIPKVGGGYAVFLDSSNMTSRINVAQVFNGNATEINDVNGEITGALSTRVTNYNGSIESLILPAVTSINKEACRNSGNLRYVEMQNCVTIGDLAFYQCSKLEEIRFPSCTTINSGENFRGCTSLVTVYLPELLTYGTWLFADCSSLQSISLPKITGIYSRMFSGCSKLETIYAPLVTQINGEYVFSGCSRLNFDFSGITYLNGYRTFNGYPKTEFYFPNVTSMGRGVFYDNTTIKKVTFDKLTSITDETFRNATNFETLILKKTDALCTFSGGSWFSNTKIGNGNGTIYVPDALVNDYKAASGWSTYAAQIKGLSEIPQASE